MAKGKVGILLSGRGSNFEAIYRATESLETHFEVSVVISNKKKAPGLAKAAAFGLSHYHVAPKAYQTKELYEARLVEILNNHGVDLVCLAGYMRIVGEVMLEGYKGRILNIHPALLPSFPGLHAQQQAIDHGVKISGCTVHFVDSGIDTGPIILQAAVRVEDTDDEETLSRRILAEEHRLYPLAIQLFFDGKLHIQERCVTVNK